MQKNTIHQRLLTHRLRGFSPWEGSLIGLKKALSENVAWVEIDTRLTADEEILVFHDSRLERLTPASGLVSKYSICEQGILNYSGYSAIQIPRLSEFLESFASQRRSTRLMVDIKDPGFEQEHCYLVRHYGLEEAVVFISWSPQILSSIHKIDRCIPLGFSHIPITRWKRVLNAAVRVLGPRAAIPLLGKLMALLGLNESVQDTTLNLDVYNESVTERQEVVGKFPVHFLSDLPKGQLGEILRSTSGAVGVPRQFVTSEYVSSAHKEGLNVYVFTSNTFKSAKKLVDSMKVDVVFTDKPEVIRTAKEKAK